MNKKNCGNVNFFVDFSVQRWKIYHQHISECLYLKDCGNEEKKVNFMKNFLHLMFGISFSLKLYGLDSFFRSLSLILSERFRGFPIYLRKVASR